MKKIFAAASLTLVSALMLASCGAKNYADGTYEGKSSVYTGEDEGGNGYGVAKITIADNVIVDCEFDTYEPEGKLKDEDYGKADGEIANKDYYNKAQKAVMGSKNYAEQLSAKGALKEVDAVSGATISYKQFNEAVEDALSKAER